MPDKQETALVNQLHEIAVQLERADNFRCKGLGEIVIQALAMFYDTESPDDFVALYGATIHMGSGHHRRWQARRLFESPVADGGNHARE